MSNERPLSDLDRMAFARGALTRRDLLRRAGMAGGALAAPACWRLRPPPAGDPARRRAEAARPGSRTRFLQLDVWDSPLYIDTEKKTPTPRWRHGPEVQRDHQVP